MARPDKAAVVTDVRERISGSTATMLTEYRGLTVGQLAQLRAELRKSGAEYRVVKNTLTKIAVRDAGFEVPDDARQLTENYAAILDELLRVKPASSKGRYLRSIHVAAAMSPSVKIDPTRTRDLWEEPSAA